MGSFKKSRHLWRTPPMVVLSDGDTLTAAQSGGIFMFQAADITVTLPATATGLLYTFVFVSAGGAGGAANISPNANDKIIGSIIDVANGNVVTAANSGLGADNKDLVLDGGSLFGDRVTLYGDGTYGWLILEGVGSWVFES